jgi:hypothetical protein
MGDNMMEYCRVTAHYVPLEGHGQRVTLLIKFDPHVIEREEMLSQESQDGLL